MVERTVVERTVVEKTVVERTVVETTSGGKHLSHLERSTPTKCFGFGQSALRNMVYPFSLLRPLENG